MQALIFANGVLTPPPVLPAAQVVIAADGGARHCLRLGLTPHYVVGDLDSLPPAEAGALQAAGAQIVQHPARKDYTDLELALQLACTLGADEILVLGALGARWDQTLANLLLPASGAFQDCRITLLDGSQEIRLARPSAGLELSGQAGDTVSLIPLAGDARGVVTHGLEYPLHDETLIFGASRGISNVLLGEAARVTLAEGLLLCVVYHSG